MVIHVMIWIKIKLIHLHSRLVVRFMESKTYVTLQRLGIISAMNSLGINPSQYIRHQLRQDEGFETDHRPFIGFRIIRLIEVSKG